MMTASYKRLFFGLEIKAPWPDTLPPGRMIQEQERHITLAFLGRRDYARILEDLPSVPKPFFKIGAAGIFTKTLFLPPHHPHVVAWEAHWTSQPNEIIEFQALLSRWLAQKDLMEKDERKWLPHCTLCRSPFKAEEWEKTRFFPLPFTINALHLYESLGHLSYQACWSHQFKPPFEELEHTADIAFRIRAHNMYDLYLHALTALAFKYPPLLNYKLPLHPFNHLDDIIIHLNEIVGKADQEIGSPFKAVSFHGEIFEEEHNILRWDMIVDV